MTRILVRRTGALGDVILTTPVLRRLREENPDAEIEMQTGYANALIGNPWDVTLYPFGTTPDRPNILIDLDSAYERRPTMHVIDAYMHEVFGDAEYWSKQQWVPSSGTVALTTNRPAVAIHAASSWASRTMDQAWWTGVIEDIIEAGGMPVILGTNKDMGPGFVGDGIMDTRGRLTIPQVRSMIEACVCFVGTDSALLHVAGATDVPIIGIFTSVKPEYRMPFRGDCYAVVPELACVGCLERRPAPVFTDGCERGDFVCAKSVDTEEVLSLVRTFL